MIPTTGLMIGLVEDREDPDGLGRVKVSLPVVAEGLNTDWIRVATLFAGSGHGNHGSFFLPQVGDEVIIGFLHGDVDQPVILGSLYNGVDKPPVAKELQQTTDEIRSTAQSRLTFTNGDSGAKIELVDKNGNGLTIDVDGESIAINAKQKISITTQGELSLSAEKITLTASTSLSASASTTLKLDGGGELSASAGLIKLN